MSKTPPTENSLAAEYRLPISAHRRGIESSGHERKTKIDFLMHPLIIQLHSCESTTDILVLVHSRVEEFDGPESNRSHNERLLSRL